MRFLISQHLVFFPPRKTHDLVEMAVLRRLKGLTVENTEIEMYMADPSGQPVSGECLWSIV